MAEPHVERRLAAVLAADVAGYSRLMEADEANTRAQFNDRFDTIIRPGLDRHGGRLVKTMGDGFLVEFASVVDAVQCAADIQCAIDSRARDEPEDRRILFRVGIYLGDVIVEGDDIHGEGVNIAARLEGLADAGGVCVSDMVRSGVRGKLQLEFADLGEQSLKNIAEPVRTYRVVLDSGPGKGTASADAMFRRPAVAVLPFENLSGDPEQDYFADGLTEDIITALSLWRSFPVIARNSTYAYKGRSPDVRKVGQELGARYVIEGSVRKSGNRVRVTAQLINAETGHHVWAERYDRGLADIFDLQDEITQRIAATVAPQLERVEQKRAAGIKPQNLDAWDCFMRGTAHVYEFSKDGNVRARELFAKAIELEPNYCDALTWIAWSHIFDVVLGFAATTAESVEAAAKFARRAVNADASNSNAHLVAGLSAFWQRDFEKALSEVETALSLNPNNAMANVTYGNILASSGEADDGIRHMEHGIQLDPQSPRNHSYYSFLARGHIVAGRYEDAVAWARKAVQWRPEAPLPHLVLAASLGLMGKSDEAAAELAKCEAIRPGFTDAPENWHPFRKAEHEKRFRDDLREAGWKG